MEAEKQVMYVYYCENCDRSFEIPEEELDKPEVCPCCGMELESGS
jgi:rRNA maturation endonuclease Nob1